MKNNIFINGQGQVKGQIVSYLCTSLISQCVWIVKAMTPLLCYILARHSFLISDFKITQQKKLVKEN